MPTPNSETYQMSDGSQRLDLYLARASGRSRSFVQWLIEKGQVRVGGEVVRKASFRPGTPTTIEANFEEAAPPLELVPVQQDLDILFEDEDLIALNKPPGWVTHPAPSYSGPTVVHYVLGHYQELSQLHALRPGIVHRLDKGTSGVLVIAKTRSSLEHLSNQFKTRLVKKTYQALVYCDPGSGGEFRSSIGRSHSDRKKMRSLLAGGRMAVTEWKRLGTQSGISWVELYPLTGRTHQLRVHLSEHGCPIVGDTVYTGGRRRQRHFPPPPFPLPDHPFLHAAALQLFHPRTGTPLHFQASPPADFQQALQTLRLGP